MATLAELLQLISGNQAENAYQNLAGALARIGQQEAQAGTSYERDLAELGYNQDRETEKLRNAVSSRGMLYSGAYVGAQEDQNRHYNYLLDLLGRQKQENLSDLAAQRINAQSSYNQTMAGLQSDFAGKSTEFIAQRMEEDAQRRANQQEIAFQNQMNQLGQQIGAAQQNFYKQQGDYYTNLTGALQGMAPNMAQAGTTTPTPTPTPKPPTQSAPQTQPGVVSTNIGPSGVTTSRTLQPALAKVPYSPRPGSATSTRMPV